MFNGTNMTTIPHRCDLGPLEMRVEKKIVLFSLYGSLGVMALCGNLAVILVLLLKRESRSVTNVFIAFVSAADLVITCVSLWPTPLYLYQRSWHFGRVMCYVVYALQGASLMWATFTLTAIAIERYILIRFPYGPRISHKLCVCIIVSIFFLGLLIIYPILTKVTYLEGPCGKIWSSSRVGYGVFIFIIRSIFPVLAIAFSHWRIAVLLREQQERTKKMRSSASANAALDARRKQQVIRLLFVMVAIFAISSFPLDILNIINDIQVDTRRTFISASMAMDLAFATHFVAMAGTLLTPLVYAWWNDSFRQQIQSLFCISARSETWKTSLSVLLIPTEHRPSQAPNSRAVSTCVLEKIPEDCDDVLV